LCRTAFAKSNASENICTLQIENQNQAPYSSSASTDDPAPKIKRFLKKKKRASFFFLVEKYHT
jgi:hypothetical protein